MGGGGGYILLEALLILHAEYVRVGKHCVFTAFEKKKVISVTLKDINNLLRGWGTDKRESMNIL